MKKVTIYLSIIILIIASVSAVIYIKYEVPRRNNIKETFANLSISARHGGEYVATTLVIQNGETKEIETRKGYEFLELKKGIYNIYNKNSTGFYKSMKEYNISENQRIDFELSKPSEVEVKLESNNSLINIGMSSENYQNVKMCLRYSLNYIFVNMDLEKIDLLDGYEDWDKCYSLDKSLGVANTTVSYKIFRMPDEDDFIEIAIIDTEYINGNYENRLNGQDLGGEDLIKKII